MSNRQISNTRSSISYERRLNQLSPAQIPNKNIQSAVRTNFYEPSSQETAKRSYNKNLMNDQTQQILYNKYERNSMFGNQQQQLQETSRFRYKQISRSRQQIFNREQVHSKLGKLNAQISEQTEKISFKNNRNRSRSHQSKRRHKIFDKEGGLGNSRNRSMKKSYGSFQNRSNEGQFQYHHNPINMKLPTKNGSRSLDKNRYSHTPQNNYFRPEAPLLLSYGNPMNFQARPSPQVIRSQYLEPINRRQNQANKPLLAQSHLPPYVNFTHNSPQPVHRNQAIYNEPIIQRPIQPYIYKYPTSQTNQKYTQNNKASINDKYISKYNNYDSRITEQIMHKPIINRPIQSNHMQYPFHHDRIEESSHLGGFMRVKQLQPHPPPYFNAHKIQRDPQSPVLRNKQSKQQQNNNQFYDFSPGNLRNIRMQGHNKNKTDYKLKQNHLLLSPNPHNMTDDEDYDRFFDMDFNTESHRSNNPNNLNSQSAQWLKISAKFNKANTNSPIRNTINNKANNNTTSIQKTIDVVSPLQNLDNIQSNRGGESSRLSSEYSSVNNPNDMGRMYSNSVSDSNTGNNSSKNSNYNNNNGRNNKKVTLPNQIGNLIKNADTQGKVITLLLVGLGVMLVILQILR